MKTFLSFLTLCAAYVQDKTAEQASIPAGDLAFTPIESESLSEYRSIDYTSDTVNITQSQSDAKNSIMFKYYSISKKNNQLLANNSALRQQIRDAQAQMVLGMMQVNSYRTILQSRLQALADEMDKLVKYNQAVGNGTELVGNSLNKAQDLGSFLQAAQNATANNTEDDDGALDESHGFLFVIGLLFVFLMLETIKYYSDLVLYSAFFQAFLSLLMTLCVFSTLTAILTLVFSADIFENSDLYFVEVYKGSFIFILTWFGSGLWILFACQSIAIIWEKHEDKLCKGEISESNKQFGIMRKLFVTNPFLPVFTEKALRPDFNFSEYLKQCMGLALGQVYSLNILTFGLVVSEVVLWRIFLRNSENFQFYTIWVTEFLLLMISLTALGKCWSICRKLIPSQGENLLVEYNYAGKEGIPLPEYLKSRIPPPGSGLEIGSIYSLKLTCSYIFLGTYPNRHQMLFWFDSYGVKFLMSLIQFVLISQSLWITLVVLYFAEIFSLMLGVILLTTTGFAVFFNVFVVIPLWVKFFTIASSVEMMKNGEMIKKVVENTQSVRMGRNWRLFWQFASLWRDSLIDEAAENLQKLPKGLKALIKESFELSSKDGKIDYLEVKHVLYRIGIEMDNDQFRVFLKDCEMDDFDCVSYKNFVKGVKRMRSNLKQRPRKVVAEVIKYHLGKETASLPDVSDFMQRNRWFMKDEDIHDFLVDLHFNLNSKELVEIDEIEFSS